MSFEKVNIGTNSDLAIGLIFNIGQTSVRVCQRCHTISNREKNPNIELSITVPQNGNNLTVSNLINKNYESENYTIRCNRCGGNRNHRVRDNIKDYPEILIIRLNRFRYDHGQLRKLKHNVGIDGTIDLSQY